MRIPNIELENLRPGEEGIMETHEELKVAKPILTKGVVLYLLSVMCNSLHHALSKLALRHVGTFQTVQLRMIITLVMSLGSMYFHGVPYNFIGEPKHRPLLITRGTLGFVNISLTYFSLRYLELPDVASLGFLTPLSTIVAASVLLGERLVWQQVCCLFVSLAGVVIIAQPPFLFGGESDGPVVAATQRVIAVSACLVAVCSMGVVTAVLRKLKDAHALQSVGWYAVVSSVGSTVLVTTQTDPLHEYPQTLYVWGLLVAMGMFGFLLQWLQSRALQLEEASYLVNFRYTSLVWATLWEYLLFRDWPDLLSIIGTLIVLSSVIYSASFH